MNETILKFGYPDTLIHSYDHWVVLLRPAQPTLGALVLASTSDATAFSDLPAEAFAELKIATTAIEHVLRQAVDYQRINYLMLMMVDPNVHFHVIPRYEGTRGAEDIEIADAGWPGPPTLAGARELSGEERTRFVAWLKASWPSG